jgi:hypothetical protein
MLWFRPVAFSLITEASSYSYPGYVIHVQHKRDGEQRSLLTAEKYTDGQLLERGKCRGGTENLLLPGYGEFASGTQ